MTLDKPQNGSMTQDFLSWEDAVIDAVKHGQITPPFWAGWQSAPGLCVTRKEHRLPFFAAAQNEMDIAGLELATRRSGGTIVPQGPGIYNVTQITLQNGPRNIGGSYMAFCEMLQNRLKTAGFETDIGPVDGSYCDGDYNLILDGKKLAGTSQRWIKGPERAFIILNHAVILVTESGENASVRVNDFHETADETRPYAETTSISLWESEQNRTAMDKIEFFNVITKTLGRAV